MLVGQYLGIKIPPQGRNDDIGTYFFKDLIDIVLFQIVPEELFVGRKGTVGEIGAISVKIGAEFPVYGISHKPTSSKYKNPFFLQMLSSCFVERKFNQCGGHLVDTYLDKDWGPHGGMFHRYISESDAL